VKDEFLYETTSKRRKGFPSETKVKRGFPRCTRGQRVSLRSRAEMITALVVRDADFKNCCLRSGCYDGSRRNHYNR